MFGELSFLVRRLLFLERPSVLVTCALHTPRHAAAPVYINVLFSLFVSNSCVAQIRIKDIVIYQTGGWSGILQDIAAHNRQWPQKGGISAYLSRGNDILAYQMKLIHELGSHVAIGVLLMTDSDAEKSGYGTCWNGIWKGRPNSCDSGVFLRPFAMYDNVRLAARMADVQYAPVFSLMNYDGVRGAAVLDKLKRGFGWWRIR